MFRAQTSYINWTNEQLHTLDRIIARLADLETSKDFTEDDYRNVVEILIDEGCSSTMFSHLDSSPGKFGYKVNPETGKRDEKNGVEWHWKLRRTRNNYRPLFDRLNEKAIKETTFIGMSPGGVDWRAYHDRHDADAIETMRYNLRMLKEKAGTGPIFGGPSPAEQRLLAFTFCKQVIVIQDGERTVHKDVVDFVRNNLELLPEFERLLRSEERTPHFVFGGGAEPETTVFLHLW